LALSFRAAAVSLAAATVAYRVPELLIAERLVNSDTAVVGLQAMHLLRGEFSGLLWGTSYQGAIEPVVTAALLALLPGRPALALALEAVLGHLTLVLALYALCARALGSGRGLLVAATVAFGPCELHNLSLAAPRIWALALVALGLWAAERALASERRTAAWAGVAAFLVILSYYSDMFVALMLPGVGLYALGAVRALPPGRRVLPLAAVAAGGALAAIPVVALKMSAGGFKSFALEKLSWNWSLFLDCLVRALGWTRFVGEDRSGLRAAIAATGIAAFAALAVAGAVRSFSSKAGGLERRLAWCGAGWVVMCTVMFIASNRPIDLWSSRYLSPVVLALPLLAPAALLWAWPTRWRAPAVGAAAWVMLFFFAEGRQNFAQELSEPRAAGASATPGDDTLHAEFSRQGVDAVLAEYWTAYRLSFLWQEQPIAVDADGSRRKQYLEALRKARRSAILFGREPFPEAPIEDWEAALTTRGVAHRRGTVGGHRFLVLDGPITGVVMAHQLELSSAPSRLAPGARGVAKLTARNTGDFPWSRSAVFASYHLYTPAGAMLMRDGERTVLPRDVGPGETVELEVGVVAPPEAGAYVVELDLVQEQVCWFNERGSTPRQFALTVAP
jgi:hypothetical protein